MDRADAVTETNMSESFFEKPILNSPYEYPARHWELDETGQPTSHILEQRRAAKYLTPIPRPKKQKKGQKEIVFDEGIGDLFPVRVAGNTAADNTVLGSIEYGAAVLHCVLILVLGHESCGAVKAAVEKVTKGTTPPGHIDSVIQPIVPAVEAARARNEPDLLEAAIRENVKRQVELLQSSQPLLAGLVQGGKTKVIGAEYDITSGHVERL